MEPKFKVGDWVRPKNPQGWVEGHYECGYKILYVDIQNSLYQVRDFEDYVGELSFGYLHHTYELKISEEAQAINKLFKNI